MTFQYGNYPDGAYIITQDDVPVPPEQVCFMLANTASEVSRLDRIDEAAHMAFAYKDANNEARDFYLQELWNVLKSGEER